MFVQLCDRLEANHRPKVRVRGLKDKDFIVYNKGVNRHEAERLVGDDTRHFRSSKTWYA